MKRGKTIISFFGVVGAVLLIVLAVLSQGEEIKFLKIKYMKAQEDMGAATLAAGQLGWNRGAVQERLGRLIQEAGPNGKIDQASLGRGIAEGASLKWREGEAQEALGAAILKTSRIVAKEMEITGKGKVQERLGTMILAQARLEQDLAEASKRASLVKAGEIQEKQGREIQKAAQFDWAEKTLIGQVQAALQSVSPERAPGPISLEALSIIRSQAGFESEGNLRSALVLFEEKSGISVAGILPQPEIIAPSIGYAEEKGGGFREFGLFSLLSFVWAMGMFSWIWTDLDLSTIERIERRKEKPAEFRKAA